MFIGYSVIITSGRESFGRVAWHQPCGQMQVGMEAVAGQREVSLRLVRIMVVPVSWITEQSAEVRVRRGGCCVND